MCRSIRVVRLLLLSVPFVALGAGAAEPLLKPVPEPDLARLPAASREAVSEARRAFDAARVNLIGLDLAEAFARLGAIYLRHGEVAAARVAFENGAALAPDDGRFPYLIGVAELDADRLEPARAALRRALALDTVYIPIRYRLAGVELALNDPAAARAALGDLPRQRTDLAPLAMLLGDIALAERRASEAVAQYRRALALDPSADALHERLARALEASGDRAGAAAARARAGPREPAFGDPLVQGIYAPGSSDPRARALRLAGQRRHAEARAVLDAALAETPDSVALLALYARIEADAGRFAEARARAAAALRRAPEHVDAVLAQALIDELSGREADAAAGYQRAVRADLEHGEARLLLGNALMRRAQFSAAAEQYRQLARLAPGDGQAWLRLAAAESRAGRCRTMLGEVNQALKGRPRDGTLLQIYVRLAATCPGSSSEERQVAVDYGRLLYQQLPNEDHSEALAMAMAATGQYQDAIDYQAQAIFEALKRKDPGAVARLRGDLDAYRAGRAAASPWPAGHPLVAPPALAPSVAPAG